AATRLDRSVGKFLPRAEIYRCAFAASNREPMNSKALIGVSALADHQSGHYKEFESLRGKLSCWTELNSVLPSGNPRTIVHGRFELARSPCFKHETHLGPLAYRASIDGLLLLRSFESFEH